MDKSSFSALDFGASLFLLLFLLIDYVVIFDGELVYSLFFGFGTIIALCLTIQKYTIVKDGLWIDSPLISTISKKVGMEMGKSLKSFAKIKSIKILYGSIVSIEWDIYSLKGYRTDKCLMLKASVFIKEIEKYMSVTKK